MTQVGLTATLNCFNGVCLWSIGYASSVKTLTMEMWITFIFTICRCIQWSNLVLCILHVETASLLCSERCLLILCEDQLSNMISQYFAMCLSLLSKGWNDQLRPTDRQNVNTPCSSEITAYSLWSPMAIWVLVVSRPLSRTKNLICGFLQGLALVSIN